MKKNKSKAELIAQLKGNKDFIEKMKFTREQFYPALIEATTSIEDAQNQLYLINTMLMQKFLEKMKEFTFKEMGLTEIINDKDPKAEPLKAMLALFADRSVFEAKELMEGMKAEINLFISEENKERNLSELKTKWIDEL